MNKQAKFNGVQSLNLEAFKKNVRIEFLGTRLKQLIELMNLVPRSLT
jgi:hypothetical protein